MYKHIFIDLDDTIWDFHANAKSALHEVYEQKKLGRYFDDFDQYFSLYAKQNVVLWDQYSKGKISKEQLSLERFLHPLTHVGVHDTELALNIGSEYLEILPTRTELIPYAKELLEYLHQKYTLTIVSNGFIEVQYKKLHSAGIEKYFSHVVLSEHAKALKPDRKIFEYALQLNNATARETIMIGDSYEADIIGAQNAGIDQVYLDLSGNNTQYKPANYTIKQLDELLNII